LQPKHRPAPCEERERGPRDAALQEQPAQPRAETRPLTQPQQQPPPWPTTYGTAFPGGEAYTLSGGWQQERSARLPWDAHGAGSGSSSGCALPYSAVDTRFTSYGGVRNSASNL
jgi:hypothetical protein